MRQSEKSQKMKISWKNSENSGKSGKNPENLIFCLEDLFELVKTKKIRKREKF